MIRRAAVALALILAATAAQADPNYPWPFRAIRETFWRPAADAGAPPDLEIHLEPEAITAKTPCFLHGLAFNNTEDGRFAFNALFHSVMSDEAKCQPSRPQFDVFEGRLKQSVAWRREGMNLALLDPAGNILMRLEPITPAGLEYQWLRVERFRYRGRLLRGSAAKPHGGWPWILFWHGYIEGSLACGDLFGTYRLDGVHFKGGAGAFLAGGSCDRPQGPRAAVGALYADLQDGPRTVEVMPDGRVILRDESGKVRMILKPRILPIS